MSKLEKLMARFFSDASLSYSDAEKILLYLGFSLKIKGSHHVFSKDNYPNNIALKRVKELLPYQVRDVKQVLLDHGYEK